MIGTKIASLTVLFLIGLAGCGCSTAPANESKPPTVLRVGFGLATGADPQFGVRQVERKIALEALLDEETRDGRPRPWLAESWSESADGLTWRFKLRPSVTFHNGEPLTAEAVRASLVKGLPQMLGPAFDDIAAIRAISDREIEFSMRRRSTFLLDGLDVFFEAPDSPLVGTGPFYVATTAGAQVEMRANDKYFLGKPAIDQIVIKTYASTRSAWADMLRGQVDMLYDVGVDALDSLQPSSAVKIYSFQRNYIYTVILNVRRPALRDAAFRRALNAAIDRPALVAQALSGHGTPAVGPVWPYHWAYNSASAGFRYEPHPVKVGEPISLTCLVADPSLERLGLVVQRQLRAIGVDVALQAVAPDKAFAQLDAGDFDMFLTDTIAGPSLLRPYYFWHSGGPYNSGGFNSPEVDRALDAIRFAVNDDAYKAGVAAFQQAIVDDPPAIFLAWSERVRAVSSRFEVPAEPQRDIIGTLRLWRRVSDEIDVSPN